MSNFDVYAIPARHRGGERNFYPIPLGSTVAIHYVPPLPKTHVTDLSEAFHEEFMERLSPYLIPGDKVSFDGEVSVSEYYPLDTNYRACDFTFRADNACSSFNEVLYLVDAGVILDQGYVSAMIDCHVKTVIMEMAKKRPGNIELVFALPDLIDPKQYGEKSLYAFLMFEPRQARLETEMSFTIYKI